MFKREQIVPNRSISIGKLNADTRTTIFGDVMGFRFFVFANNKRMLFWQACSYMYLLIYLHNLLCAYICI